MDSPHGLSLPSVPRESVPSDRRQRHLRLKRRVVLRPRPLHVLLLRYPRFLEAGLHLSQLSHFRGPPQTDWNHQYRCHFLPPTYGSLGDIEPSKRRLSQPGCATCLTFASDDMWLIDRTASPRSRRCGRYGQWAIASSSCPTATSSPVIGQYRPSSASSAREATSSGN